MHRWSRETVATLYLTQNANQNPNDGRPKRRPHLCQNRQGTVLARIRSHFIFMLSHGLPRSSGRLAQIRVSGFSPPLSSLHFKSVPSRRNHKKPITYGSGPHRGRALVRVPSSHGDSFL
jgi:hypothetical protein